MRIAGSGRRRFVAGRHTIQSLDCNGVSFVKELSFIDDGLWGFEITDADGHVLAFFQLRNE